MIDLQMPILKKVQRSNKYWNPEYWGEKQRWLYWLENAVRMLNKREYNRGFPPWILPNYSRTKVTLAVIYPPQIPFYAKIGIGTTILPINVICENIAKWYGGEITNYILDDFIASRFWGECKSENLGLQNLQLSTKGYGPTVTSVGIAAPYLPLKP